MDANAAMQVKSYREKLAVLLDKTSNDDMLIAVAAVTVGY